MHRSRPLIGCAAMAVLFVVAGCGQSADDRPTSWSYISTTIVQPNCATANCHATITQRSNVDLSKIKEGYEILRNGHYVNLDAPDASPLLFLLRGVGNQRMPPDFPLPIADIDLIERWIAARAPYDGPGTPAVQP